MIAPGGRRMGRALMLALARSPAVARGVVPARAIYGVVAAAALTVAAALWLHAAGPGARAGYDFTSYVLAARDAAHGANPYARLIAEYSTAHGAATDVAANSYV